MLCGILQSATTAHSPVLLETPSFGAAENQGHSKTWPALALSQQEGTSRPLDCLPDTGARSLQGPPHSPVPAVRTNLEATGQLRVLGPSQDPGHVGIAGPAGRSTCSLEGLQLLTGILGCGVNRDV